jgi:hypothetical protein
MQGIGTDADDTAPRVTVADDGTPGQKAGVQRAADAAAAVTRALSAAGYEPRHLSVTSSESGELVLVARLDPEARTQVMAPPAPEPGRSPMFARLAIGLTLGLVLGFLGLPRLELPVFNAPAATEPAPVPTAFDTRLSVVQDTADTALPTLVPPTAIPVTPTPAPPPTRTPVFGEQLNRPLPGWTNDPRGTAWFAGSDYRLFARDTGRFVATGVPLDHPAQDLTLTAQFHKLDGPPGGGYGLIVRDQAASTERNGRNQSGKYLVLEVGDRGDIGIWQRAEDHWIDVVPWQRSDAVNQDRIPNIVSVTTRGDTLELQVNSQIVAQVTYDRTKLPTTGGVGIFVGGDLNEVALDWLRIDNAD